jgi:uncharacterized protein YyaL (SSP411 family)
MPNRLAREASPYLQQHAENPVDWYTWGEEALERAKREDKPILLSIGYSACHWCHVMEHESFENAATAQLMNDWFVSVKVDREERPDLDQIYQLVVQLMGRSGGWPLTVFLTPEQKPFFGGTYFPPEDKYGMPGFPKVLAAIHDAYVSKRDEVASQAAELTDAIAKATTPDARAPYAPAPDLLERATRRLVARFDDEHGGFGSRPKFPSTMSLEVLLRRGVLESDAPSLGRVVKALDGMRDGGVYDQLGGGFHRYSTDEAWVVPHFEKMLYDNALLLRLYADAWRATGEARFAATAREIAAYVAREMTDAGGGFYATQDADSEGVEGKFFVWTPEEIDTALAGDAEGAAAAKRAYGVTPKGNFEESGATVLTQTHVGGGDALERAKAKLFAVREARIKPFRDEKILASWNGLMIGALADAGAALGDASMIESAVRAFAFCRKTLVADEIPVRVMRLAKGSIVKGPGFLDDYALLADAALDLYEATGVAEYVVDARAIVDAMLARFHDPSGFFFAPSDGETLIHRAKDPYDHAVPSGTAIACKALLRLGTLVGESYADVATKELERLAPSAVENPFGMSQSVCVLDRLVRGSVDVVVVGPRSSEATQALVAVAMRAYLPNRSIAWADPADAEALAVCAALAEGKPTTDVPSAFVCQGRTCSLPITAPDALKRALAS